MTRVGGGRRVVIDLPGLLFALVVTVILAVGVAATRDRTPTTYAPTLAVAHVPPAVCVSDPLHVGWKIGPLDGRTTPTVEAVRLYNLSDDCARFPITVSLTDGTGGVIASAVAPAGTAVGGALVVPFVPGVAIPPIEGISIGVPDAVLLTVALGGYGQGSISSGDGAIACATPPLGGGGDPVGECAAYYAPGAGVTLTATASAGDEATGRRSSFGGWRRVAGCRALGVPETTTGTCAFTIADATTVTALFNAIQDLRFPPADAPRTIDFSAGADFGSIVGTANAGTDEVLVSVTRFADLESATMVGGPLPFAAVDPLVVGVTATYTSGDTVEGPFTICLAGASPDRLWELVDGTWRDVTDAPPEDYLDGRVCGTVTSLGTFVVAPWASARTLTVSVTGFGDVTSSTGGIACRGTSAGGGGGTGVCSASFEPGTVVALTATPNPGWTFAGWSGACAGTGTCSVVMAADRAVGATFSRAGGGSGGGGGGGGGVATSIALRRSVGILTFGSSVTLTARLTPAGGGAGSGIAGVPVAIERSTGSGWTPIASLVTGVDGTAATTLRPVRNADYRAVFAGDGTYAGATSLPVRVNVRYRVTLAASIRTPATIPRSTTVTFTATVRPEASAGTGVRATRVTFDVFRLVGTRWSLYSRTIVAASAKGIATYRFRAPFAGTWGIRAAARSSASNYESVFTARLRITAR